MVIGICLASVATCLALSATAGGSIWVVLPLLILVQITSFADVGALAGGAVAAADPAQRGAALALYRSRGLRPASSDRSQWEMCSTGSAVQPARRDGWQAS